MALTYDPRFNIENFLATTEDGSSLDLHSAKFRDLPMLVSSSRRVVIDSSTEANLPLLAHTYLGAKELWWAILMYNGMLDPITDVYIGRTVLIPSRTQMISLLEAGNRSNLSTIEL
jgi:hypothetical protein